MKLLISLLFLFSFSSFSSQLDQYLDAGCDRVLERLALDYLNNESNRHMFDQFISVDAVSVVLCGINDLDQGSFSVSREVKFCLGHTDKSGEFKRGVLVLRTMGDFMCSSERVISFEDISFD